MPLILITSLNHVAVCVTDVERSKRFYGEVPWKQIYVTDPDGNVIELNERR